MNKTLSKNEKDFFDFEINEDTKAILGYIRDLNIDYDSAAIFHYFKKCYELHKDEPKKLWKGDYDFIEVLKKNAVTADLYSMFIIGTQKNENVKEDDNLIFQMDDV